MAHEVKCSYHSCRRTFTVRLGDDIPDYWYCAVHIYLDRDYLVGDQTAKRPDSPNSPKEQVCDHVHNIQGLFRAIADSASNDCQHATAEALLSGEMDVNTSLTIIRAFCDGIEQDLACLEAKI